MEGQGPWLLEKIYQNRNCLRTGQRALEAKTSTKELTEEIECEETKRELKVTPTVRMT